MSKYYGLQCGPLNDCGQPAGPGWLCECDGRGNCTMEGVGDFGQVEAFNTLSPAAFQKHMEESTTKFIWNAKHQLIETGILAEAGLKPGDKLIGIGQAKRVFVMERPEDQKNIINMDFTLPALQIFYERDGFTLIGYLKNPKVE